MSLLIKSLACASLLFLSSLCGSEYILDVKPEEINHFQRKSTSSNDSYSFRVNNSGEAVWSEKGNSSCFFWSEETGTVEIKIDKELSDIGFNKRKSIENKPVAYRYSPAILDNYGNVFISIYFNIANDVYPYGRTQETKIGVWNKKFGFKLLNITDVDHVFQFLVSSDKIFISGMDTSGNEKLIVLRPVDGHWPWEPEPEIVEEPVKEPPETTPWDTLPFGKHGARLHILGQLMKSTKSADEKKTIMLMTESEITNMLDLLQYDLKRSQALAKKALSEGKVNLEAEQLQVDSKKHLAALQAYIKTLPKANKCRVDTIYLPSKDWTPGK